MRTRIKYVYLMEKMGGIVYNVQKSMTRRMHLTKYSRSLLQENKKYKGILNGGRCFVIGNGPSLKLQDLSCLKNECVITCNTSVQFNKFAMMQPNFHFWSDDCFFEDDSYIRSMMSVNEISNNIISFFPVSKVEFIKKHKIDSVIPVSYFDYRYIFYEGYNHPMDFCRTLVQCFSVVEFGIAFAIYMGAKEIFMLGCDCTGSISHIQYMKDSQAEGLEYAYDFSNQEKRKRIMTEKTRGNEDFFYHQLKLFHHYRLWYSYCHKRGISLYNCTEGGILYEIPKKRLEDATKRKSGSVS